MDFLKDFGVQPILLAAQVVNFLILLFILKKLLYGPLLKVLAERRKKIEESLKNAEEIEVRLLETNEKIEKMMAKTSEDVQKLLDEGKKEREAIRAEAKELASADAQAILKKAAIEAKSEKEGLMGEVRAEAGNIALMILQKVTGKVIDKKVQKEIFDKEVKHLS